MKKIRINGFVYHKQDLIWLINRHMPSLGIYIWGKHLSYKELCEKLYRTLVKVGCDPNKGIEWNDNIAPF